jgi:hypothetical protein
MPATRLDSTSSESTRFMGFTPISDDPVVVDSGSSIASDCCCNSRVNSIAAQRPRKRNAARVDWSARQAPLFYIPAHVQHGIASGP